MPIEFDCFGGVLLTANDPVNVYETVVCLFNLICKLHSSAELCVAVVSCQLQHVII